MKRRGIVLWAVIAMVCASVQPVFSNNEGPSAISTDIDPYTGSSSSGLAIQVPAGRGGIQPNLQLQYSSGLANDLLGVGWSLEVGSIQRSTKHGIPDYNNTTDTFILKQSGSTEELVPIGGDLYAPKNEGAFMKIEFVGGDYWKVMDKSGVTYMFGTHPENREVDPQDPTRVFKYYLTYMNDPHGNYMEIQYTRVGQRLLPQAINYNWDAPTDETWASVEFDYELRADIQKNYMSGYERITDQRLSEVNVYAYVDAGATKELQRKYVFGYDDSSRTKRSLLTTVTQFGSDGVTSLPAVTFDYQDDVLTHGSPVFEEHLFADAKNNFAGDFDGDGQVDTARYLELEGKIEVRLSDGRTFSPVSTWITDFPIEESLFTGDFNGDGRVDVGAFDDTTGDWLVALSSEISNGFINDGVWIPNFGQGEEAITTGDFNGDGMTDIASVFNDGGGNRVASIVLSTGSSFDISTEVTVIVSGSNDQVFSGDFNGDGYSDLAMLITSAGHWEFILNPGDYSGNWISMPPISTFGTSLFLVTDITGDGMADVGYLDYPAAKIYYKRSLGTQFNSTTEELPIQFGRTPAYVRPGDYDGDGLLDFMISGGVKDYETIYMEGAYPDLLSSTDNGVGGVTSITYMPSTTFNNEFLPFPVQTVATVTASDSRGDDFTTTYEYRDGLWDANERTFCGFAFAKTIDAQGNYTETDYRTDAVQFKGRIAEQRSFDDQEILLSKVKNQWQDIEVNPGSYFVYLEKKDNFVYGSVGKRTSEEFFYQETTQLGNLTKAIQYGEVNFATGVDDVGNDTRTVETAYVNNTAGSNYIVGLPRETAVYDNGGALVRKTWFYYDSNDNTTPPVKGLLTKKEDWAGDAPGDINPETLYSYDSFGNLLTTTDPMGNMTTIAYDTTYHIFPVTTTNALQPTGHTVVNEYYGVDGVPLSGGGFSGLWGQLKSTTDPNQEVGMRVYDTFGDLTATISPLDSITHPTQTTNIEFFSDHMKVTTSQRITHGQPETIDTVSFIDGLGRTIQTKTLAGDGVQYIVSGMTEYNNRGLPEKQYLNKFTPNGLTVIDDPQPGDLFVTLAYDAAGRVITTTNPDGSFSTADYDDWTTVNINENGHRQESGFDAYGRLIEKREYTGADGRGAPTYPDTAGYTLYATTLYSYDSEGNLIQTQDQEGNITTISYDKLGRKTAMNDPDMGVWQYEYDLNGNLIKQTDAKAQVINFEYDALNRLTRKYDDGATMDVNYTYDTDQIINTPVNQDHTKGRLTQAQYGTDQTSFDYDEIGREIESIKKINGTNYGVGRNYDALNNLLDIQYPDDSQIFYKYNPAGQIEAISNDPTLFEQQSWNWDGQGNERLVFKSESRSAKFETNPKSEFSKSKTDMFGSLEFLSFEFISDFGFRISSLGKSVGSWIERHVLGIRPAHADEVVTDFRVQNICSSVTTEPLDADFNLDGKVNNTDLAILKGHMGQANASFFDGDASLDGTVDEEDLRIWQDNQGTDIRMYPAHFIVKGGGTIFILHADGHREIYIYSDGIFTLDQLHRSGILRADDVIVTKNTLPARSTLPLIKGWDCGSISLRPLELSRAASGDSGLTLRISSLPRRSGGNVRNAEGPKTSASSSFFAVIGRAVDWLMGVTPAYAETIVDNDEAEQIGDWYPSSGMPNYHGNNYFWTYTGSGSYRLKYRPNLAQAGDYEVLYILPNGSASRPTNARYKIFYDGGDMTKYEDQEVTPGGNWISLGTYPFAAGTSGYVELNNDNNGDYTIADAVKFVYGGGSPAVPTATLNANPTTITEGESTTLTWSSTDADDCTASNGWSGTKATSGNEVVSPTVTTTYTLTCSGPGGTSQPSSVIITVNPAPPPPLTAPVLDPITPGDTEAYLTWSVVSSATGYNVKYGTTSGGGGSGGTDFTADPDCVAAWKLDEASGTVADSCGANTGTVSGSLSQGVAGQFDNAIEFFGYPGGNNAEVNLGSDASLDNLTARTITAWIYPHSSGESGGGVILNKSYQDGWVFRMTGSDDLAFSQAFTGGVITWKTTTDAVQLNTWQHVAVVYAGSSTSDVPKIYLNGVEQTINAWTPYGVLDNDASQSVRMGILNGSQEFDGLIDEVAVFKRMLTGTEINEIKDNGLTGGSGGAPSYEFEQDAGPNTALTVTGLTNDTTYYFAVEAYNAVETGPLSNEKSATPEAGAGAADPQLFVEDVQYNAHGQIEKIEYGNGITTEYDYDVNLRLTRIHTYDAQAVDLQDLNYTYDPAGNILSITDNINTADQTFTYDELGRLDTAVGETYGTKDYDYDKIGNIKLKDGRTYFYEENGDGPHAVSSLDDGTTFTYDLNGNMLTKQTPDLITTGYEYDVENRLIEVKRAGVTIAEYTYDGDGGRTAKTAYDSSNPQGTCFLAGTPVLMANGTIKPIEKIEVGEVVVSLDEQTGEQVISNVTETFKREYTSEYLVINHTLRVTEEHPFFVQGEWKKAGALKEGDKLLGLSLNEIAIRSIEKVSTKEAVEVYNIEVGQYHNYFVARRPVSERKGWYSDDIEGYLVHNKFPGETANVVYQGTTTFVGSLFETNTVRDTKYVFLGNQRIASITNGKVMYYHADHLGGTNLLTDKDGELKELIEYEPFGTYAVHQKYGLADEVAWFYFTGQQTDDESGLMYYGARYYDPDIGRFITPDTIVPYPDNPQAFNRYSYAGNNPVNYIDPTGHFWKWIVRAVAAIVGFVAGGPEGSARAVALTNKIINTVEHINSARNREPPRVSPSPAGSEASSGGLTILNIGEGVNGIFEQGVIGTGIEIRDALKSSSATLSDSTTTDTVDKKIGQVSSGDLSIEDLIMETNSGALSPQEKAANIEVIQKTQNQTQFKEFRLRVKAGASGGELVGGKILNVEIMSTATGNVQQYTFVGVGYTAGLPVGVSGTGDWASLYTKSILITEESFSGSAVVASGSIAGGKGVGYLTINWTSGPAEGVVFGNIGKDTGVGLSADATKGYMFKGGGLK